MSILLKDIVVPENSTQGYSYLHVAKLYLKKYGLSDYTELVNEKDNLSVWKICNADKSSMVHICSLRL